MLWTRIIQWNANVRMPERAKTLPCCSRMPTMLTKPDEHFGGFSKEQQHIGHLHGSLFEVMLIDAQCINP
jgi:hypothetical protein